MLNLNPKQLQIVKTILQNIIPNRVVVAFGSRVTTSFKAHSDLDLCVMGDVALSWQELSDLHEAFSESDLPMRVDIVDWASSDETFQKIIKKQSISF